jgi:hypothetical protein
LVSQKKVRPIHLHTPKWHQWSKVFGRGVFSFSRRIFECRLCHGHWSWMFPSAYNENAVHRNQAKKVLPSF